MPVSIQCPGCDQRMNVPETVRGKTIRCTTCGETFKVPMARASRSDDDDDDRPTSKRKSGDVRSALDSMGSNRKRRRDDDDDDIGENAEASKKPIIIGGAIAAVVAVGVGLFFALSGGNKKQVAQNNDAPAFVNPIPNPNPDPFQPVDPNPNPNPFQPANPVDVPDPFQPKPNPVRPNPVRPNPVQPNPMPQVGGGGNPIANPFRPNNDGDEVGRFGDTTWKADVDAPKEKFTVPDDIVVQAPMPQGASDEVIYASTPSPFFVMGNNRTDRGGRVLFNLNSMPKNKKTQPKFVGSIRGKLDGVREDSAAISPDGKHLVVMTNDTKGFEVWSFDNGQAVRKIEIPERGSVGWVDFGPTSDQVILFHQSHESGQKSTIQVWDIVKGELLHEAETPKFRLERKHYALSPNRKYIAFCTEELGYVHRLSDGELVGVLPLPKAEANNNFGRQRSHVEGMAFSNDGKEVAALVKSDFDKNFWACSWDMASGKPTAEMDLTDTLTDSKVNRNYTGPQIEYMPDDRAWFVRGSLIIDRDTGILLAKRDFGGDVFPKPRRLLPNGMLLEVVRGSAGGNGVVNNKIDMKGYESAINAARGNTGPKLDTKKADTGGVQTIRTAPGAAWKLQPDIVQAKGVLGPVPVIPRAGGEVNVVHFARPESAQALVVTVTEVTTPFVRKVARCERFDLVSKKSLGSFELPGLVKRGKNSNTVEVVSDISPEGGRIAVRSLADANRVDVFDGTGKHVVGFLPYEAESTPIEWLGFAGEDRLLTLSDAGKLVLWDVAAAKALFQVDGNSTGPALLSPGRKLLALFGGTEIDLFDTTNLAQVGSLATGVAAPDRLKASLAFRTEAAGFAAAVPLPNNRMQILTWDLKSGQPKASFDIAMNMLNGIQWCSDTHLLVGGQELVDVDMKTSVWQYTCPNRPVTGPLPDSRVWVVGWAGSRAQGSLTGVRLPDAQLTQNLQLAKGPGVQSVLKPGGKISIRVDGSPDFAQTLTQQLTARFQQDGFEIGPNAPVTYVVTGTQGQSGDTAKLTSFGSPFGRPGGAGGGGETTINIPQVAGTASLVDGQGQPLWSDKHTAKPSFFFRTFRSDEDPTTVLGKEAWGMFSGWATSVRRPTTIYRLNGQLLMLPGHSNLPLE